MGGKVMFKKSLLVVIGIMLFCSLAYAQETVTLTTYYPAPYGVYRTLRLFPRATPASCQEGELIYDNTAVPTGIYYCDNVGVLQPLGGGSIPNWTLSGNQLFPNDLNWRVGIGMNNPARQLDVYNSNSSVVPLWVQAVADTPSAIRVLTGGTGTGISILAENANAIYGQSNRTAVNPEDATAYFFQTGSAAAIVGRAFGANNGTGVKGLSNTISGWAGYFEGGSGLYGSRIVAGGTQSGATKFVYDVAEDIRTASDVEATDVVVIDPNQDRQVIKSSRPYDSSVAGIISENPVLHIGKTEGFKPLALAGQVYCKVTTENGPIKRGDILVTSSKPGFAMKADLEKLLPSMMVGKALEPLENGEGKIVILLNLN